MEMDGNKPKRWKCVVHPKKRWNDSSSLSAWDWNKPSLLKLIKTMMMTKNMMNPLLREIINIQWTVFRRLGTKKTIVQTCRKCTTCRKQRQGSGKSHQHCSDECFDDLLEGTGKIYKKLNTEPNFLLTATVFLRNKNKTI